MLAALRRRRKFIAFGESENALGSLTGVFDSAKAFMFRGNHHPTLTIFLRDKVPIEIIDTNYPDRATRYVMLRDLAKLARIAGANGVVMVAEAWVAFGASLPQSGLAGDAPDRKEILTVMAADAKGGSIAITGQIKRRRFQSKRVKELSDMTTEIGGFPFIFAAFLREWCCTDEDEIKKAYDRMEEMGVEFPRFGSSKHRL